MVGGVGGIVAMVVVWGKESGGVGGSVASGSGGG